jgi:hypothetical protein
MNERCAGHGLIVAGLIVTLIGAAIIATRTFQLPREWATLGVGLALLVAGLVRRRRRLPQRS